MRVTSPPSPISPSTSTPPTAAPSSPASASSMAGGCACGALRFAFTSAPMFVHCCHCTRCQRETGGPFAHHAMVEFSRFELRQGEAEFVAVPTDSGGRHWVARCPACRTVLWNEHGAAGRR